MEVIKVLMVIPLVFLSANALAASEYQILRLNALSELDGNHSLNKIKLCSNNNQCISYNLNKKIRLSPKANGEANFLGAINVPVGFKINTIEFNTSSKNKSGINGKVKLSSPLTVEKDLNYQALFTFKNISTNLYPTNVNTHYYRRDLKSIFYNPKSKLETNLKYGVKLEIPAYALKEPQIFTVDVYDIAQEVPMVDLFPYITLEKNLKITFSNISNTRSSVTNNKSKTIISNRTNVFNENSFKISFRAASRTCDQIIKENIGSWIQTLKSSTSGVVKINSCTNIPPYTYILIADNSKKNVLLPVVRYSNNSSANTVALKPITYYQNTAIAGINGFTWDGESGTKINQKGVLRGNIVSGGKVLSQATGNYFTLHSFKNGTKQWREFNGPYKFPSGIQTAVGSTTSIVKNNVCSSSTNKSRWSAIGANDSITVMLSSTSSNETNAKEMCPVFKAISINNAIRLDGGPSAAIFFNKTHLNPLSGLYRIKYGSIRNVAYPLILR